MANTDAAIVEVQPSLAIADNVHAIEFYVPGQPPVRYVRAAGAYILAP